MGKKKGVAVLIDNDMMVRSKAIEVMKEQAPDVVFFAMNPEPGMALPKQTDVFIVAYDMNCTKGTDVVKKIKKTHPKALIIGWGVSSKEPEATDELIDFFDAGVKQIIDRHPENVAKVINWRLRPRPKKMSSHSVGSQHLVRP